MRTLDLVVVDLWLQELLYRNHRTQNMHKIQRGNQVERTQNNRKLRIIEIKINCGILWESVRVRERKKET